MKPPSTARSNRRISKLARHTDDEGLSAAWRPSKQALHSLTYWSSALILSFAVTSAGVHFAQPSVDPIDVALSYYMNGRLGWLLAAGLVALGAGSLLLVAATYGKFGSGSPRQWLVLLATWGLGCVLCGLFPPDAFGEWNRPLSLSGEVHGIAAMVAFVAFPIAAVCLSKLYESRTGGQHSLPGRVATLCAALTVLFFVCLAPVFRNRPPYALGLVERAALGSYVVWLLVANRAKRNVVTDRAR